MTSHLTLEFYSVSISESEPETESKFSATREIVAVGSTAIWLEKYIGGRLQNKHNAHIHEVCNFQIFEFGL